MRKSLTGTVCVRDLAQGMRVLLADGSLESISIHTVTYVEPRDKNEFRVFFDGPFFNDPEFAYMDMEGDWVLDSVVWPY